MQTFLPYPSFGRSAVVLDYKRLGKQRVEAWQILSALRTGRGWIHHPATKMWKGYESTLAMYGMIVCTEWISRGYNDSLLSKFIEIFNFYMIREYPPWFGIDAFHASHRSNLLRKNPEFYKKYEWSEDATLSYYWPTKQIGGAA